MRKTITVLFRAERGLFRNLEVPGFDIASADVSDRAVKSMLGNILGLWRDLNDPEELEISGKLDAWWIAAEAEILKKEYSFQDQFSMTVHRYKSVTEFTKEKNSSPRRATYHSDVHLKITIALNEKASGELSEALKRPFAIPYMGQSNCLAQVHLERIA